MEKGKIIHSVAGTYIVLLEDGEKVNCKPRGKLRLREETPLTGDLVLISRNQDEGIIEDILPRVNFINRPPIANIDQMIAVIAPKPSPNFALFDRILITGEQLQINIVIVINKYDLGNIEEIIEYYKKTPYKIIVTSAETGYGIDELVSVLKDKESVLAGQSGVGKSSILNNLLPKVKALTQEISEKRGFGRHTTKTVSLLELIGGGLLADTPGFNRLDINEIKCEDLQWYYPEMEPFIGQCKFRNCLHKDEPSCAIKRAVKEEKISESRYRSYISILEEILESEKRLYQ
ncbi:MAG: ribosome small subunit-dependent GTPase A [Clostridia bacterium]